MRCECEGCQRALAMNRPPEEHPKGDAAGLAHLRWTPAHNFLALLRRNGFRVVKQHSRGIFIPAFAVLLVERVSALTPTELAAVVTRVRMAPHLAEVIESTYLLRGGKVFTTAEMHTIAFGRWLEVSELEAVVVGDEAVIAGLDAP